MFQLKANKWIKPGLYTTFDKFSVVILGFVNFFILARVLSKGEFGIWVLFTSIISILETLREGFIKQPFIAYLASASGEDRNKIATAAFFLNAIYSGLISIGVLGLAYPLELFWTASPLASLLKVYAITNLVFIPFSHFEYLQQSKLDFKGIFLSHLTRSIILTLFIGYVSVSAIQINLFSLAIVSLIGNSIGAMVCISTGWQSRHILKKPTWKDSLEMMSFGKYSFGTNLASLSIRNMDSWMLGKLLSTESVALYNPAIRVSNLVEIPTLTVANLVFPKMSEGFGSGDTNYASQLYERSVGLLMALMIPLAIFMFVFSDWIVLIVAGKNYQGAGSLLQITAFYTLFIPFGRQFGILLDAVRRPKINFYFVLGTAVLNVCLNYFFILQWGIKGAAYGTLVTYLLRFASQQLLLFKLFQISTSRILINSILIYVAGFNAIKRYL